MRAARQEPRVEQRVRVAGRDRTIGEAARRPCRPRSSVRATSGHASRCAPRLIAMPRCLRFARRWRAPPLRSAPRPKAPRNQQECRTRGVHCRRPTALRDDGVDLVTASSSPYRFAVEQRGGRERTIAEAIDSRNMKRRVCVRYRSSAAPCAAPRWATRSSQPSAWQDSARQSWSVTPASGARRKS